MSSYCKVCRTPTPSSVLVDGVCDICRHAEGIREEEDERILDEVRTKKFPELNADDIVKVQSMTAPVNPEYAQIEYTYTDGESESEEGALLGIAPHVELPKGGTLKAIDFKAVCFPIVGRLISEDEEEHLDEMLDEADKTRRELEPVHFDSYEEAQAKYPILEIEGDLIDNIMLDGDIQMPVQRKGPLPEDNEFEGVDWDHLTTMGGMPEPRMPVQKEGPVPEKVEFELPESNVTKVRRLNVETGEWEDIISEETIREANERHNASRRNMGRAVSLRGIPRMPKPPENEDLREDPIHARPIVIGYTMTAREQESGLYKPFKGERLYHFTCDHVGFQLGIPGTMAQEFRCSKCGKSHMAINPSWEFFNKEENDE